MGAKKGVMTWEEFCSGFDQSHRIFTLRYELPGGMVWYSSVLGHFGDDFTGQMTQPTVS